MEILKKHLQVHQSLAYEALLESVYNTLQYPHLISVIVYSCSLVVQLARDLQNDFYPHFKEFFIVITSLLKIHDATVIEVNYYIIDVFKVIVI